MEFKIGDKVMINDVEVVMFNCSREFKVTNIKPYSNSNIFVEITNDFEQGNINKRCLKLVNSNKADI